jgi:hypothetical protein
LLICKSATARTVVVMAAVLSARCKSAVVEVISTVLVMTPPVMGAVAAMMISGARPTGRLFTPHVTTLLVLLHAQPGAATTPTPVRPEGSVSVRVTVSVVTVVSCRPQPAMLPPSESTLSYTYNSQSPFGLAPLKVDRLPPYGLDGAGAGRPPMP